MANQAPRKKDMWDYAPYIIIIIFCLIIGTWAGYVVEVTSSPKRGIQWLKALESMTDYINLPSFAAAFKALFTSSYVRIGTFFGTLVTTEKGSSTVRQDGERIQKSDLLPM